MLRLLYVLVELKGRGQLEDADVVLDGEAVVVGVHGDGGDLDHLLGALEVLEVVRSGQDLDVLGGLAVAAVSGGDDELLVVDGAAAEVVAAEEVGLEGDLKRKMTGYRTGSSRGNRC